MCWTSAVFQPHTASLVLVRVMFNAGVRACGTQIGLTGCGEEGGAVACNTRRNQNHKAKFATASDELISGAVAFHDPQAHQRRGTGSGSPEDFHFGYPALPSLGLLPHQPQHHHLLTNYAPAAPAWLILHGKSSGECGSPFSYSTRAWGTAHLANCAGDPSPLQSIRAPSRRGGPRAAGDTCSC